VNPTPIDDAHAIQLLLGMGRTREQIATRYRQLQPWISRRLSLMDLPIALQKRVHDGRLSADAGYKLTFLGSPENVQRMVAEIEAAGQEVTGPEIERRRLAWEKEEKREAAEQQRKETEEREQAAAAEPTEVETTTFVQGDDEAPPFSPTGEPSEEFNAGGVVGVTEIVSEREPLPVPQNASVPEVKRGRGRPKGSKSKNPKPKAIKPRSIKTVRAFFRSRASESETWYLLCRYVLGYIDGEVSDEELDSVGREKCI
jgi:septum formation inhibitor MinC